MHLQHQMERSLKMMLAVSYLWSSNTWRRQLSHSLDLVRSRLLLCPRLIHQLSQPVLCFPEISTNWSSDQRYDAINWRLNRYLPQLASCYLLCSTVSRGCLISYKSFKTWNLLMENSYCDHRNSDKPALTSTFALQNFEWRMLELQANSKDQMNTMKLLELYWL